MRAISIWVQGFCEALIRMTFPLLVLFCLLIFPAYKGLWIGYVPLLLGAVAGVWVSRFHVSLIRAVDSWSRWLTAFWLYLLPACVQVVLILVIRPEPATDGYFVFQHAELLARTGVMDPMTYYPPAQTWWYAGWFLLFGPSTLVAQLSHVPLSIGVVWTTKHLGQTVLRSPGPACIAAMLVAWYPSFLAYVLTTPYYHYLYTLLTLLMVWALVVGVRGLDAGGGFPWPGRQGSLAGQAGFRGSLRTNPWLWLLLAGMAAGLGALTKAVQLIAPVQVVTWLMVLGLIRAGWATGTKFSWIRLGAGFLIFVLGLGATLAPWMVRNARVFDAVVPVCTSGGLVLYSANNPDSNGLYSGMPDTVDLETPQEMLAYSHWCSSQAKMFIREYPLQYLNLAWRKFLHTWGSEATFAELINWRGAYHANLENGFSFLFLAGWAGVVILWTRRSWGAWRARAPLGPFELLAGILILSNAFVYVVFEGGDRHHLPWVPLLVLLAVDRGDFFRVAPAK